MVPSRYSILYGIRRRRAWARTEREIKKRILIEYAGASALQNLISQPIAALE
jgi:hypothetical protein